MAKMAMPKCSPAAMAESQRSEGEPFGWSATTFSVRIVQSGHGKDVSGRITKARSAKIDVQRWRSPGRRSTSHGTKGFRGEGRANVRSCASSTPQINEWQSAEVEDCNALTAEAVVQAQEIPEQRLVVLEKSRMGSMTRAAMSQAAWLCSACQSRVPACVARGRRTLPRARTRALDEAIQRGLGRSGHPGSVVRGGLWLRAGPVVEEGMSSTHRRQAVELLEDKEAGRDQGVRAEPINDKKQTMYDPDRRLWGTLSLRNVIDRSLSFSGLPWPSFPISMKESLVLLRSASASSMRTRGRDLRRLAPHRAPLRPRWPPSAALSRPVLRRREKVLLPNTPVHLAAHFRELNEDDFLVGSTTVSSAMF